MTPAQRAANDAHCDRYGPATAHGWDDPDRTILWATWAGDRPAAEAAAAGNRDHFGHPSWTQLREGLGWVTVCDLGPARARAHAEAERELGP